MSQKLTLSVDPEVIENAKKHAKSMEQSLSLLVENYLRYICSKKRNGSSKAGPLVNELAGALRGKTRATSKDDYLQFLMKKYR